MSDYCVCTTWGKKARQLFLLHVLRKRLEYPDLKRAVVEQARLFDATRVLVEDASSGQSLTQDLKHDGFYLVTPIKPKGDKVMRLSAVTAAIEAGQVFIPAQAPWLEDYLHELMMFPAAKFDDQVDSTSQALSNAFIFQSEGDGWFEYIRQELREREEQGNLEIRVNCDDLGMRFHLITGRVPLRAADGSFLITKEEAEYLPANCYRVDESQVNTR